MSDAYKLDEATAREIFERDIVPDIFPNAVHSEDPKAVVFGGQPGAGKTKLVDRTVVEMGGATVIEGDQFRRYHPRFDEIQERHGKDAANYTGPDAGRWTEMAINHGIENRYNLAIEGTMRNPDTVRATTGKLREAGYDVEARVMAVPDLESWQGVHLRYERQHARNPEAARFTTRDAHDAAYTGMMNTLDAIEKERLASRLSLHTRAGDVIYDSRPGQDPARARETLERHRDAPFSDDRAAQHDEKWGHVQRQQRERGAHDTERWKVETWRDHDRQDLVSRTAITAAIRANDAAKAMQIQNQRDDRQSRALEIEKLPNRDFTEPEREARTRQIMEKIKEKTKTPEREERSDATKPKSVADQIRAMQKTRDQDRDRD